jgi:hypothetical protein
MTQQTFTDNVVVQGSQDITQLRVQGHTTQTQPLQTWTDNGGNVQAQVAADPAKPQLEVRGRAAQSQPLQAWTDSAGNAQARVAKDGRLQTGDLGLGTPDALVEANAEIQVASPARPLRGVQSFGRLKGALSSLVAWAVHELELMDYNQVASGVSGLQTVLRAKLTHKNTGNSSAAELRAGDFQSINQTGSSPNRIARVVGARGTASSTPSSGSAYTAKAIGVEATVTNDLGGDITDASAFEVVPPANLGTIGTLYGLRVPPLIPGGTVSDFASAQFGDDFEVKVLTAVPTKTPPASFVKLYPKLIAGVPHLFAKDSAGIEYDLSVSAIAQVCQGRLTLSSGAPVSGDVSGATLYWTPFVGMQVALYDGTTWYLKKFSEISAALPATTNTVYDVFLFDNAGTLTLELVPWTAPASGAITGITNASPPVVTSNGHGLTNDMIVTISGVLGATGANGTWRVMNVTANTFELHNDDATNRPAPGAYSSGGTWQRADQNTARVTAISLQDGVYVKSGDATRRYVGTVCTGTTAGQTSDTTLQRFVWNFYNQIRRQLYQTLSVNHTYGTFAWRPWGNNTSLRVQWVQGLAVRPQTMLILAELRGAAAGNLGYVSFGVDAPNGSALAVVGNANNQWARFTGAQMLAASAGYHYVQATELPNSGLNVEFNSAQLNGELLA